MADKIPPLGWLAQNGGQKSIASLPCILGQN